jgi:hypothetical protein
METVGTKMQFTIVTTIPDIIHGLLLLPALLLPGSLRSWLHGEWPGLARSVEMKVELSVRTETRKRRDRRSGTS